MGKECRDLEPYDPPLFHNVLHPRKRAFLTALAQCGMLTEAARLARIDRKNHYWWLENDPDYEPMVEKARRMAADAAEDEVYRRGFVGFDHPVIHQGEITDHYTQYSDLCAIFYLKGARPNKYRDNYEGLPNGGKVQINFINFNNHPASIYSEKVSASILESNGSGEEKSGQGMASESREGQDRPQFCNFKDVP